MKEFADTNKPFFTSSRKLINQYPKQKRSNAVFDADI